MSSYSRDKGNRAEREVVAALRRMGYPAATTRAERGGTQGGADIHCPGLPIVSFEVKDQSRDALPSWLDQARSQAGFGVVPVVVHKRRGKANAEEWFATLQFADLVELAGRTPDIFGAVH